MSDETTRFSGNPKRILHVYSGMPAGGIGALIMSIYRLIDKRNLQFDFLLSFDRDHFYNAEIQGLGGRIFALPCSRKHPLRSAVAHEKFFRSHPEYSIAHFHMGAFMYPLIRLCAAMKADVHTRILHAHSSAPTRQNVRSTVNYALHLTQRPSACKLATDLFACSTDAARWYGFDKFSGSSGWKFIRNGADTSRFEFNPAKRASARAELGFSESEFVVGNVGRFDPQKNQMFLVDIFSGLLKARPESRLLLVGGYGSLEGDIRERCESLGIWDRTICLKGRTDVDRLLCAMDAFVFPSSYEGLSIAHVEAQANGLSCYTSNTISDEGFVTDSVVSLPIDRGINPWVEALASVPIGMRNPNAAQEVKSAGFDIRSTAEWLQEFYLSRFSGARNSYAD